MTKRSDGRWVEAITIDGKRRYFYGKTKAEVLKKIREATRKDEPETPSGPTFADVAKEWDRAHEAAVTYNAHRVYRQPYKRAVSELGETRLQDLTSQDIDLYIRRVASEGFAKRTVQGYLSCVNLILEYAQLHGKLLYNPASVVQVPAKLKAGQRSLPGSADIDIVKKNVDAPFGLFAYFLLYTGCRRGEALALTWDDVDLKKKTIRINKSLYWVGNKPEIKETKTAAGTRTIILLDALEKKLTPGTGYVFGGETPLTDIMYKHRWAGYVKATGVTFTPHQLRHLYATILYECGVDEKIAQELMGHASIRVTRDVYTHIRQQQMDKVAAMLNEKIKI